MPVPLLPSPGQVDPAEPGPTPTRSHHVPQLRPAPAGFRIDPRAPTGPARTLTWVFACPASADREICPRPQVVRAKFFVGPMKVFDQRLPRTRRCRMNSGPSASRRSRSASSSSARSAPSRSGRRRRGIAAGANRPHAGWRVLAVRPGVSRTDPFESAKFRAFSPLPPARNEHRRASDAPWGANLTRPAEPPGGLARLTGGPPGGRLTFAPTLQQLGSVLGLLCRH
jgi:hypothetical protein